MICLRLSVLDKGLLSDISVICKKCYLEVRMYCKGALLDMPGHDLQASEEIVMDIYTGCFFLYWYPPKKYGKPRLGESTLT